MLPLIKNQPVFFRTTGETNSKNKTRSAQSQTSTNLFPLAIINSKYKNNHYRHASEDFKKVRKMYQSPLSKQIKDIDKQIRHCQLKIKKDKLKAEFQRKPKFTYKIVNSDIKCFDFLTNPQIQSYEQTQKEPQQTQQQTKEEQFVYDKPLRGQKYMKEISALLQDHYSESLKRKFQRRVMPHQVCRRKVPKLLISKNNRLQHSGCVQSKQQHFFRVLNKQGTPTEIYPSIPKFSMVKDNISKNIMAYFSDYKPFIEKALKLQIPF